MKNTENQQVWPHCINTQSFSAQMSSCPFILHYKIPNVNYKSWARVYAANTKAPGERLLYKTKKIFLHVHMANERPVPATEKPKVQKGAGHQTVDADVEQRGAGKCW